MQDDRFRLPEEEEEEEEEQIRATGKLERRALPLRLRMPGIEQKLTGCISARLFSPLNRSQILTQLKGIFTQELCSARIYSTCTKFNPDYSIQTIDRRT